jgi:glycosyltransferase involved in cell wall biosynthesis
VVSTKSVKPFFSIITCTKNSQAYFPACLTSLSSQTFSDYEHLVIDGHSTDATLKLVKKTDAKVISSPPRGISAAMNEGVKHARGKYLYFLHSDDQLADAHVLERVHTFLVEHPNLDWAYGQIAEVDHGDHQVGIFPTRRLFQHPHPWLLWFYNYIPHQGVFMKKSVFDQYGLFDEHYQICMDYEYWLRIARTTRWDYLPLPIARYRVHSTAVSSNKSLAHHEKFKLQYSYVRYPRH